MIYKLLFIDAMTEENESVSVANKRNYTEEETNAVYRKGKGEGRTEGMFAYQKRLAENLQRDNASFNQKFQEIKK